MTEMLNTATSCLTSEKQPAAEPGPVSSSGPIIFFDGVCGLCHASVDWVLHRDQRQVFRFAPLQGETARSRLAGSPDDTTLLKTVVLCVDGHVYRKSAAVVRILQRLGPLCWCAGTLLWMIPRPLRDLGYSVVSRYRYRWFGKKETCRMPDPAERRRLLP